MNPISFTEHSDLNSCNAIFKKDIDINDSQPFPFSNRLNIQNNNHLLIAKDQSINKNFIHNSERPYMSERVSKNGIISNFLENKIFDTAYKIFGFAPKNVEECIDLILDKFDNEKKKNNVNEETKKQAIINLDKKIHIEKNKDDYIYYLNREICSLKQKNKDLEENLIKLEKFYKYL